MTMNKENSMKIVALMGKAGSGKDTLLHAIMQKYPGRYHEIVSCTTRPPREGEVDGVNYHFLSIDDFTQRLLNGDLLEATEFNDWHYGTLRSTLDEDKINVGVFNPAGVICLTENPAIDLDVWYIKCPDKIRLIRQLNREEFPNVAEIIRRYGVDEIDFADLESEFSWIEFENIDAEDIDLFTNLFGQEY